MTFLFQMKQIKNRVNPVTFLKKKNSQNDVCVYSACRSAAIMLSVLCSGTTRGGWGGLSPLQPKMGGPHKLSKSDEFFYRGRGGAMIQFISVHVDLDTGLSRCEQKALLWLVKLQKFLQEW